MFMIKNQLTSADTPELVAAMGGTRANFCCYTDSW